MGGIILDTALIDSLIEENPLDKIIIKKILDRKYAKSDYKVEPFSRQEIKAILDTATGQLKNFIQFALFSGLRPSESIALNWSDIDWETESLNITHTIVYQREKDETKTEASRRTVKLLAPAVEALENQKKFTFSKQGKIFNDPLTSKPWLGSGQIRERWEPLLRKAKVRYRNPYQTRHTYASTMLSNGEDIMWVVAQMGHVDMQMVMRTYAKWIPDNNQLAGYRTRNAWDSFLLNGPNLAPKSDAEEEEELKADIKQLVAEYKMASPRGFEPLLPP